MVYLYYMKYLVANENTLGVMINKTSFGTLHVQVLAGSVIRGGHNPLNGYTFFHPSEVRVATSKDFHDYRVICPTEFECEDCSKSLERTKKIFEN